MARRITLADVAKKAGVSASTVSFVLNNRPNSRIPVETAERVRSAAEELGYAVDRQARGLKTGRSGSIGFVSDEVTVTRYSSAMIRGILGVGDARNYAVLMAETGRQVERVTEMVRDMLARRVDGVLLGFMQARQIDKSLIPPLADLPMVVMNGRVQGWPSVLPNEFSAGVTAAEHLVERGHRSIALVGRSDDHLDPEFSVTIKRRFSGLDHVMGAAGLSFALEITGSDWEPNLGYVAAAEVIKHGSITAVVAANDRIAFGLHQGFQAQGYSVPDDISVISFDDEPLASYLRPGLTTVRLPYEEMGRIATDLVLDLGAQNRGETAQKAVPSETLVPMPLVERSSVRVNP